jgi:hypothetical protein
MSTLIFSFIPVVSLTAHPMGMWQNKDINSFEQTFEDYCSSRARALIETTYELNLC